jgi:hypothetical protein
MIGEGEGTKVEAKIKITVTAKDEKQLTTKSTATVNGKESPGAEEKIDLTKPFNVEDLFKVTGSVMKGIKMSKGKEGKETITIGKTKYECKLQTFNGTFKVPGEDKEAELEVKIWTSPDAPALAFGLVKMESKTTTTKTSMKTSMILDESGKGK